MQLHAYSIFGLLLSGVQFIHCETTTIVSAAFKSNATTTLAASTSGPNRINATAPHGTVSNMNATLTANSTSAPVSVNNATLLRISNATTPGSDGKATAPTANKATTVPTRDVTTLSSHLVTSTPLLDGNETLLPAVTPHASETTQPMPNLATGSKTPPAEEATMYASPVSKVNSPAGATATPSGPISNATAIHISNADTTTIHVSFAKTTGNGANGFPTPLLWPVVLLAVSFLCL